MQIAIAIGAAMASLVPLVAMWITFRQKTDESYERQLEKRCDRLEEDLAACERQREDLAQENLRLMRRLLLNGKS